MASAELTGTICTILTILLYTYGSAEQLDGKDPLLCPVWVLSPSSDFLLPGGYGTDKG
jgi:hypothetical protein